jgi:hypothetical protein
MGWKPLANRGNGIGGLPQPPPLSPHYGRSPRLRPMPPPPHASQAAHAIQQPTASVQYGGTAASPPSPRAAPQPSSSRAHGMDTATLGAQDPALMKLVADRGASSRWKELHRRRCNLAEAEAIDPDEEWTVGVDVPPRHERLHLDVRAGDTVRSVFDQVAAVAPSIALSLNLGANLKLLFEGTIVSEAYTLAQAGMRAGALLLLAPVVNGQSVATPRPHPPSAPMRLDGPPPIGRSGAQVWTRPPLTPREPCGVSAREALAQRPSTAAAAGAFDQYDSRHDPPSSPRLPSLPRQDEVERLFTVPLTPSDAKWFDRRPLVDGSVHAPGGKASVHVAPSGAEPGEPAKRYPWTPPTHSVQAQLNQHHSSCFRPSTAEQCLIARQQSPFRPLRHAYMRM